MVASLASFGRSVLLFPVTALRAIGAAMWLLVANPVGLIIGGQVWRARPYLVGERGPELFVPGGASGRIETNDRLRRLTADGTTMLGGSTSNTTNRGTVTFAPTLLARIRKRSRTRLIIGCAGTWRSLRPSSADL